MEEFDSGKIKKELAPLGSLENPFIDSDMKPEEALRPNPKFKIPKEVFEMQTLVTVKYLSFDGKYHQGQIVMDKRLQKDVEDFFEFLIKQKFPVKKVIPIAHQDYDFDDEKSMKDNNTSGFNPRYKVGPLGGSTELSNHAQGLAFDLNPAINPYFGGPGNIPVTPVKPEDTGEPGVVEYYNIAKPGTVTQWIAEFLQKRGWTWGMEWYKNGENANIDTQHFEKKLGEILKSD